MMLIIYYNFNATVEITSGPYKVFTVLQGLYKISDK